MKNKILIAFSSLALLTTLNSAAVDISDTPIFVNSAVPPLNLLVMGKDHKLYYEAYTDNSDLDGDSVIDVGYKPDKIDYFGYFNSNVCYTHDGGKFNPSSAASGKKCSGKWSGDFLNYLTTSRMDALRKVLYGGYRSVDSATETVLQAAYIPQDGHTWGKEYSATKDVYSISDYAPLSNPAAGHYHLFAVTTDSRNIDTAPSLKVLTNTKYRVWEWVSRDQPPVAQNVCGSGGLCVDNGPSPNWTMIPESVVSGLTMRSWRHYSLLAVNNKGNMDREFNSLKTFCGSSPVNHIQSVLDNDGNIVKRGNNIFSDDKVLCLSSDSYLVEIQGKINIEKTGNYFFRSDMNGSLDMTIGSQRFESYNGNLNEKIIYLIAGEHDIKLRYSKGWGGEDYWEIQWIPVASNFESTMTSYQIKIAVCPAGNVDLREDNCQSYPNDGESSIYKPTGLLHDFGANDKMYFGLLTGSYQKNIDGGVIRNNIDSFAKEIDPKTGIYKDKNNGIVSSINSLKLYGFKNNAYEGCGLLTQPLDTVSGQKCHMWGNPIAEMMYEGLRYYSGASSGTSSYLYTNNKSVDESLGLKLPKWESPYREKNKGGYPACAKPVMTVISDITPSYDYNVPGSKWSSTISSDTKLASILNVSEQVDAIWAAEGGGTRKIFIGESGGVKDYAPSSKSVSNLSTVRGLSPEEPSKNGTYYSAGIARFGATKGIQADSTTNNKMMTYAVALTSPLPQIKFPTGNGGLVTVVPFGKSVGGGYGMSPTADFQPTLTIVDFYVQALANMDPKGSDKNSSVNGGRPYAQFRINYEDVEQGNDHDMDAIVLYTVLMDEQGKLVIKLEREFDGAGIHMHMGYMVSGTTKDGIYLEVKNKGNTAYKMNTPPGQDPGYCAITSKAGCNNLPIIATREFVVSNSKISAELLPGPLWYAAKYGMPDRDPSTVKGDPENYFLVTNALTLKEQLTKSFNDILQKNAAVTRPAAGKAPASPSVNQDRNVFKTEFDAEDWTGSIIKEKLDLISNKNSPVWVSSIPTRGRAIKMANSTANGLIDFTFSNLENRKFANKNLQDIFKKNEENKNDGNGENRVDYIKGARTYEGSLFRERSSLLGDIVHSNPVVVNGAQYLSYLADSLFNYGVKDAYSAFADEQIKKDAMVYVGANDGMLHGFSASSGIEKFAFIPTPVIENLHYLTHKNYGTSSGEMHKFFVDGSLTVSDVYFDSKWHTVLVGTLGAGGRGAFALNVTDPNNIELLWEFTEDSLGSKSKKGALSDLGYTFGKPEVVRLQSGEWVAVINNGYNSHNKDSGVASLFLLDIKTGNVVKKIDAQGSIADNGLSSVRVADFNGDGKADYVYAGDIQGNLWRFDLTADKPQDFSVGYGAKPFFEAGKAITARPSIVRHPSGRGYLIIAGTGLYLGNSDITTTDVQSLYGIWDEVTKSDGTPVSKPIGTAQLQQQKIILEDTFTFGNEAKKTSQTIRLVTNESMSWATQKGWQLKLINTGNLQAGTATDKMSPTERIVDDMEVLGNVLFVNTRTPTGGDCESGIDGFTYVLDPATGGRLKFDSVDLSGDTNIGSEDRYRYNGEWISVSGLKAPAGGFLLTGDKLIGSDGKAINHKVSPVSKTRESWFVIPRELAKPEVLP